MHGTSSGLHLCDIELKNTKTSQPLATVSDLTSPGIQPKSSYTACNVFSSCANRECWLHFAEILPFAGFSLINEEDDRESQCGEDEFNPCLIEEDSQKVDKGVQW